MSRPRPTRQAPPLESRTDPGAAGGILLAMDALHFAYEKGQPILQGFSLDLREGEAVALLGSNGAGKTTLLRLAKGLLKPAAGRIRTASGRPLMKEVGLVFQNPDESLFAASVEEECAFLPRNLGLARPRDRARALLARLGMAGMADRVPFTLSYGEKRRVSLASVLARGADPVPGRADSGARPGQPGDPGRAAPGARPGRRRGPLRHP